jgi:hypothetical protein
VDNILKLPPSFGTLCLTRFTKLKQKETRRNTPWFTVAVSARIARFISCNVSDFCVGILLSVPIGRNWEQWGPATVQAMGYSRHKNVLRPLLARYIFHRSTDTQRGLKWHDVISSSMCGLCPIPHIIGQKRLLKCVILFCTILYLVVANDRYFLLQFASFFFLI